MPYTYTTQRQVREAFWIDTPQADRVRIPDHSGNGKMYCTDTRCAFAAYVDMLLDSGMISESLANRVTL